MSRMVPTAAGWVIMKKLALVYGRNAEVILANAAGSASVRPAHNASSAPDGTPTAALNKRPNASLDNLNRSSKGVPSLASEPAAPQGMMTAMSMSETIRNIFANFCGTWIDARSYYYYYITPL